MNSNTFGRQFIVPNQICNQISSKVDNERQRFEFCCWESRTIFNRSTERIQILTRIHETNEWKTHNHQNTRIVKSGLSSNPEIRHYGSQDKCEWIQIAPIGSGCINSRFNSWKRKLVSKGQVSETTLTGCDVSFIYHGRVALENQ